MYRIPFLPSLCFSGSHKKFTRLLAPNCLRRANRHKRAKCLAIAADLVDSNLFALASVVIVCNDYFIAY